MKINCAELWTNSCRIFIIFDELFLLLSISWSWCDVILEDFSMSTTAWDVYLADSAQVPRVHAKYTTDSTQVNRVHVQVHRGDSRGVLGHGRGVLGLKLHEEKNKYTEAMNEVYLLSFECNFNTMLATSVKIIIRIYWKVLPEVGTHKDINAVVGGLTAVTLVASEIFALQAEVAQCQTLICTISLPVPTSDNAFQCIVITTFTDETTRHFRFL